MKTIEEKFPGKSLIWVIEGLEDYYKSQKKLINDSYKKTLGQKPSSQPTIVVGNASQCYQ